MRLFLTAGGGTEIANLKKVTIRRVHGQPDVQMVNLYAVMRNEAPDVPLMADDMVYVND
jgi:hypothetical protein